MRVKQFAESGLPPEMQEKADRMNLFEADVPAYETLPLPFVPGCDPEAVRQETLKIFAENMFGEIPPCCEDLSFNVRNEGVVFDGIGIRKEIDIVCRHNGIERVIHMLLYTPAAAAAPSPCFFCMNFKGNHTTTGDPGVSFYPFIPYESNWAWHADGRAYEDERGCKSFQYEYETMLKAGYAFATVCHFDLFPDHPDGFDESIMPMFYSKAEWDSPARKSAAISAWAWGYMRAIDVLVQLPEIDGENIMVSGHSRLGKTAIWAGANDPRIKLVFSCCSGTGGAKMTRRYLGENVEWLENWRTYWFVPGFFQYVQKDTEIPFDQHQLLACIAPRKLVVASASEDVYADPLGEFLAAKAASPAWELYGKKGLPADAVQPPPGGTVGADEVHYFLKPGGHSCTPENWADILAYLAR